MNYAMKTVDINLIDPNPYRDFVLYPIDEEQIGVLVSSYSGSGDFGTIEVRPFGERYQQAFGHHRLVAMKRLGFTTADVKLRVLDEDEMVRDMVAENASQKGGTFASQVDSVAAVVRRLAFALLVSENAEQFAEVSATADTSQGRSAFTQAKANLIAGGGIGQPLISQYAKTLPRGVIDGALAYLKNSGIMASLVAKVQTQVEELQEAATRAEKARVAAAEKARIEAEEEQRKAVEAAKAAAAAAAKASAARKAQAEAEAAAAADRAAKLEAERKRRAEAEAKARAKAQEEAERALIQREAAEKAKAAAAARAEAESLLHPDAIRILKNERHQRAALPIIKKHPKCFPVEGQPALFNELYAKIVTADKVKKEDISFERFAQALNEVVGQYNTEYQKTLDEIKRQREAQSKAVKAHNLVEELRASFGRFTSATTAVAEACQDPETAALIIDKMGYMLPSYVNSIERSVEVLRERFGVPNTRGDVKRVEKVIPEYVESKQIK